MPDIQDRPAPFQTSTKHRLKYQNDLKEYVLFIIYNFCLMMSFVATVKISVLQVLIFNFELAVFMNTRVHFNFF